MAPWSRRAATIKVAPDAVDDVERLLTGISATALESKRMAIHRYWFRFFYGVIGLQGREDAYLLTIRELSQRIGSHTPVGNMHYV